MKQFALGKNAYVTAKATWELLRTDYWLHACLQCSTKNTSMSQVMCHITPEHAHSAEYQRTHRFVDGCYNNYTDKSFDGCESRQHASAAPPLGMFQVRLTFVFPDCTFFHSWACFLRGIHRPTGVDCTRCVSIAS